ncbi:hypothetical protein A7U60_g1256 [Sanghuangporus baumii]|uniref:Uncharacterized protein n=1 Tax=Sanghuangporus baumii TaxID=108892 RepID=A0A9Q5I4A1_SANBA|nr:hypothetical protein A7U60_g1256 [Sanghuangporus baumii]
MDAQSTTSSLSMSSSSLSSLILKPPGEVGRPQRGGYNLQRTLQDYGWDEKSFLSKRNFVHSLIDKHLEVNRSITFQDKRSIQKVIKLAKDQFPEFGAFKDAWPVLDMCKMHLRYTSGRERMRAIRRIAQAAKAPQTVGKRVRDRS